jgi:transcriptional regulator with PAS, ATPase and Fis domain
VESLTQELETSLGIRRVVGRSRKWRVILAQIAKVAPTETTVLLSGESGTGKEILARMIHRGSPRMKGPFIAINCAALPETLLESELFGHEKGAFTGAAGLRLGCIERAAGGILFLDEVGEMSLTAQAKLLRVLEQREFTRVGGARTLHADVRVVAATNRDLKAALSHGLFREDLYYRLRVFEVTVPPLRERSEDILPLAEAFLEEIGHTVGRPAGGRSAQVNEALMNYTWPGNARELRNVLERATILCDGGLITLDHLPPEVGNRGGGSTNPDGQAVLRGFNLESAERDLIIKALEQAKNNRAKAARLLGVTRPNLYNKMQKHGLASTLTPRADDLR